MAVIIGIHIYNQPSTQSQSVSDTLADITSNTSLPPTDHPHTNDEVENGKHDYEYVFWGSYPQNYESQMSDPILWRVFGSTKWPKDELEYYRNNRVPKRLK